MALVKCPTLLLLSKIVPYLFTTYCFIRTGSSFINTDEFSNDLDLCVKAGSNTLFCIKNRRLLLLSCCVYTSVWVLVLLSVKITSSSVDKLLRVLIICLGLSSVTSLSVDNMRIDCELAHVPL